MSGKDAENANDEGLRNGVENEVRVQSIQNIMTHSSKGRGAL